MRTPLSTEKTLMIKNYLVLVGCAFALLAGTLFAPQPAPAQDQGPTYYTYVSQWTVPRDQWNTFDKAEQAGVSQMKKYVAEGLLVAWGIEANRVHSVDGFTHAEWFTATSRENLLKVLEDQWAGSTSASFVATTKHADLFLHTMAHGGKAGASGTGYLRVAFFQAKLKGADAFEHLLMDKAKPFLDSEVVKGNITVYNIDTEEVATQAPGGYNIAVLFPDGAAMDRYYSDLSALQRSDPTTGVAISSLTRMKDFRSSLGWVSAYQNK